MNLSKDRQAVLRATDGAWRDLGDIANKSALHVTRCAAVLRGLERHGYVHWSIGRDDIARWKRSALGLEALTVTGEDAT